MKLASFHLSKLRVILFLQGQTAQQAAINLKYKIKVMELFGLLLY